MTDNLYRPPRYRPYSELVDDEYDRPARIEVPPYKLFKTWHVVLATFLGSALAGGIVMAINYQRLDRSEAAIKTIIWSIVAAIAIFAVRILVPDLLLRMLISPIVQMVVMFVLNERLFEDDYLNHERKLGEWSSGWAAAGIGLLSCLAAIVLLFGVVATIDVIMPGALPPE